MHSSFQGLFERIRSSSEFFYITGLSALVVFMGATAPQADETTWFNSEYEDTTLRFDSNEYGVGILYLAEAAELSNIISKFRRDEKRTGALYLWFPGRTDVITGSWETSVTTFTTTWVSKGTISGSFQLVCFKYDKPLRGTVTGTIGRRGLPGKELKSLECLNSQELASFALEKVSGDALDLASDRVSCRICPPNPTIVELTDRANGQKRQTSSASH